MVPVVNATTTGVSVIEASWLLGAWDTYMRASGNPSSTRNLRLYHLQRVARAIPDVPADVSTDQLVAFLAHPSWAPETRRSYRASLRAYFSWYAAAGHRVDNPAASLPAIKVPRGVPRPTPEQIILEAMSTAEPRVVLMVRLAAELGLRRGEIAQLERRDLEPALWGHTLTVHGKGGHVRSLPVPNNLADAILAAPDGPLFPNPKTGRPLTPHHVGKLVSSALLEGWTCHTLRHRCATVAYDATRDLRAVQELLGHAKPETTARYTAVRPTALLEAVTATAAVA